MKPSLGEFGIVPRQATSRELQLLMRGLKAWHQGILPGGITSRKRNVHPILFDLHQLAIGITVEMEHTNNPGIACEIAMDHLLEDKLYYARLEKMERHA